MDGVPPGEVGSPLDAARAAFGDQVQRAVAYHDLLAGRGVEWGLIGPRETARLWDRHLLNSVAVASAVGEGVSVVDVGSGAGLPGIPVALARPDLRVVLVEPLLRRANFLELAVAELELGDRVRVVRARAEDHRATYDVVTCRAVAPLARLLGWTQHLIAPSGVLVALKGASAEREVSEAARDLRRAGLNAEVRVVPALSTGESTRLLVLSRR